MVGSLLAAVGIGLLTYIFFEVYGDNNEGHSKEDTSDCDIEVERRSRRKKFLLSGTDKAIVEICLSDIASAIAAIAGGSSSIELCTNRAEGGVTPFIGLVEEVVRMSRGKNVQIHVLIRPRPGNFVYSAGKLNTTVHHFITNNPEGISLARRKLSLFRFSFIAAEISGFRISARFRCTSSRSI